jgi:hypothetical protein
VLANQQARFGERVTVDLARGNRSLLNTDNGDIVLLRKQADFHMVFLYEIACRTERKEGK